jgi:hypothetical protein
MYLLIALLGVVCAWPLRGAYPTERWDYTYLRHRAANITADHPINRLYK